MYFYLQWAHGIKKWVTGEFPVYLYSVTATLSATLIFSLGLKDNFRLPLKSNEILWQCQLQYFQAIAAVLQLNHHFWSKFTLRCQECTLSKLEQKAILITHSNCHMVLWTMLCLIFVDILLPIHHCAYAWIWSWMSRTMSFSWCIISKLHGV